MGDLEGHQESEAAHTDMSGMLFLGTMSLEMGTRLDADVLLSKERMRFAPDL